MQSSAMGSHRLCMISEANLCRRPQAVIFCLLERTIAHNFNRLRPWTQKRETAPSGVGITPDFRLRASFATPHRLIHFNQIVYGGFGCEMVPHTLEAAPHQLAAQGLILSNLLDRVCQR